MCFLNLQCVELSGLVSTALFCVRVVCGVRLCCSTKGNAYFFWMNKYAATEMLIGRNVHFDCFSPSSLVENANGGVKTQNRTNITMVTNK